MIMFINIQKKIFALVFAVILFAPGCTKPEIVEGKPPVEIPQTQTTRITLLAAGDSLVHDIIYNRARVSTDSYNFDPSFEHINYVIKSADIAFINQETVLGGRQFGYTGYPVFNSPQEIGLGLIKAGFNVINQASNHTMDRGEGAVFGTMDFWDSHNVMYLGIFRTEEERKTAKKIIEKNGIKVGFLSYTYGLNGFSMPRDKPWLVGMINKEVMSREIDELRPLCDILVVSMHWGDEFRHTVNSSQKELAALMAEHKVDLILGHHPHVTAPMEIITRPDGGKLTVYYSLGDFLSHTQSSWNPNTLTGALAYITITKTITQDETVSTIETAGVIPTVCHYNNERSQPFVVYPLWDYTDELAAKHYKKNMSIDYLYKTARNVFEPSRIISKEDFERDRP